MQEMEQNLQASLDQASIDFSDTEVSDDTHAVSVAQGDAPEHVDGEEAEPGHSEESQHGDESDPATH